MVGAKCIYLCYLGVGVVLSDSKSILNKFHNQITHIGLKVIIIKVENCRPTNQLVPNANV